MSDPWTRREAFAQALFGVTAIASSPGAGSKNRIDRGSEITLIGLFSTAPGSSISPKTIVVMTSGYMRVGKGQGLYVHDNAIGRDYVSKNPRSSFIANDGRVFRLQGTTIDLYQLGAAGDGVTDDTSAIQAALDLVEAEGGGTVDVPSGKFKTTATLNLPGNVSLGGRGQTSVFYVHGCDGINIGSSDSIAPRRIANFWIRGEKAEEKVGINSAIIHPARVQGLIFENIYISFFDTGVKARGLWHCVFRSVTMNHVWTGFRFYDRNVKIVIDTCHLTHGGMVAREGYSTGIQVGDPDFPFRPEDIQVDRSIIYGFSKGIVWRMALFGGVTSSDIDACSKTGIEIVTADGGFTFRDNWVQVDHDREPIYGVNAVALGYTPELGNILIANNRINAMTAPGQSVGIFFGNNQANILVSGNSVTGAWSVGVKSEGAQQVSLTDNRIASRLVVMNSKNIAVRDNYVGKGVELNQNSAMSIGPNFGSK